MNDQNTTAQKYFTVSKVKDIMLVCPVLDTFFMYITMQWFWSTKSTNPKPMDALLDFDVSTIKK